MSDDIRESVRRITEDSELRNCLYLVKNGVPFDVAFSLKPIEAMAWSIIFGELDGSEFDWNAMAWKKPET